MDFKARCIGIKDEGIRIFKMIYDGIFYEILDQLGTMPLPPYIKEKVRWSNRYQTVYAKLKCTSHQLLVFILMKLLIERYRDDRVLIR